MTGGRKISWVRWKSVCQPMDKDVFAVRDIQVVNLSLLSKWRWRLVEGGSALWIKVLKEKYGNEVEGLIKRA